MTPPLLRDPRLHAAAVMLVALIPRMVYLAQIRAWPFFHHPILDSRTQWKWAGILTQSYGIGNNEVVAKAPLYAYFLAVCRWLLKDEYAGLFAAHLLQLLMGAATCGLTYWLGRRVFGPAVGLIAGLTLALYSPGIYRDGQLLDTSLATSLTLGFTMLFLSALDSPRGWRAWLKCGVVLGLVGITRPNLLLLGVSAAAATLIWLKREIGSLAVWRAVAILTAATLAPILLIVGRNYLITGGFVPISSTGGINLYTGNNPTSDGYSPIPSGIAWERTWYVAMGAGKMNSRAQDAYWRERAMRFIRNDPGAALALFVKKMYLYWNAYEIPNNISYDWGRAHSSVLRTVPLTFAVIGPLGLLGMALGGWRSRKAWALSLFILTQMVAVSVFFITGRYRMPALPMLSIFAAFGVVEMGRLAASRRAGAFVLGLAALAGGSLLVNSDIYGARRTRGANRDWFLLGQSYFLAQDYRSAADAFRHAARQHPDDADAVALLGQSEMQLGLPDAAAKDLRRALEIAPDFTLTATKLAALYLAQGWPLEEPERLLRRAVDKQPRNATGLAMLVRVQIRLGWLSQAQSNLDSLARLFVTLNRSDTRTADTAQAVRQAAAEAHHAGLTIPPELQQGYGGSASPGGTAGRPGPGW